MRSSPIASTLDRIIGSWKPSAAATAEDLTTARQSLADAFASGFEISSIEKPSVIGVTIVPPPTGHPSAIPNIRSITDVDPKSVSDRAGMKIEKTLGPFVDAFGVPHWIDIIPIPTKIPILAGANAIGYLIVDNPTSPALHAGSLWISCAALGIPLLTSGAAGLSFSSGTVTVAGTVIVTNTGIEIGPGGSLTLKLTLSPPAAAPGTPSLGRDARAMLLSLPATVTVVFSDSGAAITSIDDSSATVYGTACSLKRNANKPFVATLGAGYIVYPCTPSITTFAFSNVLSTDVVPSRSASVVAAGWGIAITTAPASQLGAASSAGAIVIQLGAGASLQFGDLLKPALLGETALALSPGAITIAAANGARNVTDIIGLWQPSAPSPDVVPPSSKRDSEIVLTIRRGGLLFCTVSTTIEDAIAFGTAAINVDRPVAASGARLPIEFNSVLAAFVRLSIGKFAVVEMSGPPAPIVTGPPPRWSIALQNALLTVSPANSAVLLGQYQGSRLTGSLQIQFGNATLLPMLPDPYASGNVSAITLSGTVSALDQWTLTPGATVNFSIIAPSNAAAPPEAEAVAFGRLTLLDLSTNVDQWGVSISPRREGAAESIAFEGVAVAIPQDQLVTYALPGISWEPVVDDKTNNWYQASSPGDGFAQNDGPATLLAAQSVQLVPAQADVALEEFVKSAGATETFGQFTLPFGIIASLNTTGTKGFERPEYLFTKGAFANKLNTARQLSIFALGPQAKLASTPALPGSATTETVLPLTQNPPPSVPPYPPGALSYGGVMLADPRDVRLSAVNFFEEQFSLQQPQTADPEIPVGRIDLSGYGTSTFSEWANLDLGNTGVTRARFDVLVGRTAYELVQIQSIILPYGIRMTQTVIFERFDDGLVVRHETDWKAVNDGAFEIFANNPGELFSGALSKLTNIKNIFPTGGASVNFNSAETDPNLANRPLEFVPVTFDADAVFQSNVTVTANGITGKPVAATQMLGYAQTTPGHGATHIETLQLMQQLQSGVSGSAHCILTVGASLSPNADQYTINASSLNVTATSVTQAVGAQTIPAAVAVAVLGTPRLPRDGAWGITRRASGSPTPTAVDPTAPVPLVRAFRKSANATAWMILDAVDVLSSDAPATLYGLLQSTGTSKSIFENAVVDDSGQKLSLAQNAGNPAGGGANSLADIGSLLGAADIFPALANVLQIPPAVADTLNFVQDGFKKTFTWTISKNNDDVTPLDDQTLLNLGVVSIILKYQHPDPNTPKLATVTFAIDATASPRWSLDVENLALAVMVAGFSDTPILTITGGFAASETSKAGFTNIDVDYGDALADIKKLLSGIQGIVKAIGGAVDLDVGFSDDKLTVHDGFALPTLPLGLGEISNIALDLGTAIEIPKSASFSVGIASKENPFTWIVDPLAGNGAIVLGTSGGDIDVYIEAGIGLALELDVAVASGGASILLEFSLLVAPPDITICIALTGNANLSVLGGVASASITLTASIEVEIEPGPLADFSASCSVGIHISICWVISVDFDGTWGFHESLALH